MSKARNDIDPGTTQEIFAYFFLKIINLKQIKIFFKKLKTNMFLLLPTRCECVRDRRCVVKFSYNNEHAMLFHLKTNKIKVDYEKLTTFLSKKEKRKKTLLIGGNKEGHSWHFKFLRFKNGKGGVIRPERKTGV